MFVEMLAHPDFLRAKNLVYDQCGFDIPFFEVESESKDYGSLEFKLGKQLIKFRVGKITPVKIGQFVTLWKRGKEGIIQPFDLDDPIDLFVISVRDKDQFGQFVFPKRVLYEKGIISKNGKGGKRAIRIYPPWDNPNSKQARKSQKWQSEYFYEIDSERDIDVLRVQRHFQYEKHS